MLKLKNFQDFPLMVNSIFCDSFVTIESAFFQKTVCVMNLKSKSWKGKKNLWTSFQNI